MLDDGRGRARGPFCPASGRPLARSPAAAYSYVCLLVPPSVVVLSLNCRSVGGREDSIVGGLQIEIKRLSLSPDEIASGKLYA